MSTQNPILIAKFFDVDGTKYSVVPSLNAKGQIHMLELRRPGHTVFYATPVEVASMLAAFEGVLNHDD